eukprot:6834587-Pyramimonas_sp.AAC.2
MLDGFQGVGARGMALGILRPNRRFFASRCPRRFYCTPCPKKKTGAQSPGRSLSRPWPRSLETETGGPKPAQSSQAQPDLWGRRRT